MLSRTIILAAALAAILAAPALAQQAQQAQDPALATYAQLLNEANGRVAGLSAQLQQANQAKVNLETRLADLQKQLDAAKAKAEPTPTATPK
jgi:chromosome segregation ATPase